MLMMTVIIKMTKLTTVVDTKEALQYNPDQKDTDYDEHGDACYVRP